jgi:predicted glutamine amidotransferase
MTLCYLCSSLIPAIFFRISEHFLPVFRNLTSANPDGSAGRSASGMECKIAIRSTATGPPGQQTNCHPFRFGNWLFMHNGALAGFGPVKRDLTFAVGPSLYPISRGPRTLRSCST